MTEDQVQDLLTAFGELKSFSLAKDSENQSKGYAFCEFVNPEITDIACEGLHGLELGDKKLAVHRASISLQNKVPLVDGALPGAGLGRPILPIEILGANGLKAAEPTTILLLLNIVRDTDMKKTSEYNDIIDDIKQECLLFGDIQEVVVPRPVTGKFVAGVGKVFVKYFDKKHAAEAQRALAGRKFMERTTLATFFDETRFEARFF